MALRLTVQEFKELQNKTSQPLNNIPVKIAKGSFSRLKNAKLTNLSSRKKSSQKSRNLSPTEKVESIDLTRYLNDLKDNGVILNFAHIPNETYTKSWLAGKIRKQMGVSSGFPDYIVLLKDKIIFIELKRQQGGKTSDNQKLWIAQLQLLGFSVSVCNGASEAIKYVEQFI